MKLAIADKVLEHGGIENETSFAIKASGHAFRILSSGIYSNKIGAVVRETACNAYDAHVALGESNKPIHIHLPSGIEPWYAVRDQGIGLSHEDITQLYSTYFESTKGASNEFVGAFGLGSKSPFSYVHSFTVNSVFDGVLRCYTAFVGDNGVPQLALLSEHDSTEHNGIEVQIPVKPEDYNSFASQVAEQLQYFDPKPEVNDPFFEWPSQKFQYQGRGWKLLAKEYSHRTKLIQGFVAYPLDISAFGHKLGSIPTHLKEMVNCLSFDITFDIGVLEPAASRETLSYTKGTVTAILARLQEVYDELEIWHKQAVDTVQGTPWQRSAGLHMLKQDQRNVFDLFKESKDLIQSFGLNLDEHPGVGLVWAGPSYRKSFRSPSSKAINFNPWSNIEFFEQDSPVSTTWIKNHIAQQNLSGANMVLVEFANSQASDDFWTALGNPPVTLTSKLARPPVKKTVRKTHFDAQAIDVSGSFLPGTRQPIKESFFQMDQFPEGGFYVPKVGRGVVHKQDNNVSYATVIDLAHSFGFFDNAPHQKVYVADRRMIKKIAKSSNWINAFDYISAKIGDWFAQNLESYAKSSDYKNTKQGLSYRAEVMFRALAERDNLHQLTNTKLGKFLELYSSYGQARINSDHAKLLALLRFDTSSLTQNHQSVFEPLGPLLDECLNLYPLLDTSAQKYDDAAYHQHVIDYVLMVENKLLTQSTKDSKVQ